MIKEKYRTISIIGFCVIETILWFTYIVPLLHFGQTLMHWLQWLSILLCFVFAFLMRRNEIETAALFLTSFADLFLVALQPNFIEVGMVFFLLVQFTHGLYFFMIEKDKKIRIRILIGRLVLSIILIIAAIIVMKGKVNFVIIAAMIYGANLIMNIVCGFKSHNLILAFGLILMLLCDITIALHFIPGYETSALRKIIESLGTDLTWFFYLPSQLLIALSVSKPTFFKLNEEESKQ